jgi:SSS family solute:Na+ symporter
MQNVLELMLYSYAFMVSGLFIPVLGALFWRKVILLLLFGMLAGATTILLIITENKLPLGVKLPEHLDANIYGISISLLFVTISTYHNNKRDTKWNSK